MNIYGGGKSVCASNRVWPLINKFIGADGNAHAVPDKNFSFATFFFASITGCSLTFDKFVDGMGVWFGIRAGLDS